MPSLALLCRLLVFSCVDMSFSFPHPSWITLMAASLNQDEPQLTSHFLCTGYPPLLASQSVTCQCHDRTVPRAQSTLGFQNIDGHRGIPPAVGPERAAEDWRDQIKVGGLDSGQDGNQSGAGDFSLELTGGS